MVTRKPLACNNLASDAAIIPLPNEEDTPPVTKIYLVVSMLVVGITTLRDVKVSNLCGIPRGIITDIFHRIWTASI